MKNSQSPRGAWLMQQESLLDWQPPQAYRNTDPETCREAAEIAATRASRGRLLVLQHLSEGPKTDFELASATGWQQTSIGKRRGEAMYAGYVEKALDAFGLTIKRPAPSGAQALVWRLTPAGIAGPMLRHKGPFHEQHGRIATPDEVSHALTYPQSWTPGVVHDEWVNEAKRRNGLSGSSEIRGRIFRTEQELRRHPKPRPIKVRPSRLQRIARRITNLFRKH